MLGTSWQEKPELLWRYRLSKLAIDDTYTEPERTIQRTSNCRFEVAHDGVVFIAYARGYPTALEHTVAYLVHRDTRGGKLKMADVETSRFAGVRKRDHGWVAQISVQGGKRVHIGTFRTELEAALAFNFYVFEHNLKRKVNQFSKEELQILKSLRGSAA